MRNVTRRQGLIPLKSEEMVIDGQSYTARHGMKIVSSPTTKFVTVAKGEDAYRAECSHCRWPLVIMSPITPSVPGSVPPKVGDAVRCDHCLRHSVVNLVNGFKVQLLPITVSNDLL